MDGRPECLPGFRIDSCCNCRCHIADHDDCISKRFAEQSGRAFLFANVANVKVGEMKTKMLTLGKHIIADICCMNCGKTLGWRYEKAYEESQKYKEGKFILARAKIMKENW